MAVLHGYRVEEIAQLKVTDVGQLDKYHYFDIHEEDGNRLKNANAVRRVPLHSDAIKLGFLDYVCEIRARGYSSLWPTLKPGGRDNRLSHYYSRQFGEYCRSVKIYNSKRTFHALRASFRTAVEGTDAKNTHVAAVMGHELGPMIGQGAGYVRDDLHLEAMRVVVEEFEVDVGLGTITPYKRGLPIMAEDVSDEPGSTGPRQSRSAKRSLNTAHSLPRSRTPSKA